MSTGVFERLGARRLTSSDFDAALAAAPGLSVVFFWGHDCPNCEVAKASFDERLDEYLTKGINWFESNVYEESELGTRFGLFGIPVFLFYKDGRSIGRITSFPGSDRFLETIERHAR